MKIGFYAPLKAPSHAKPSGDREIGRLLFKALKTLGHEVEMLSDLRSWEGRGDAETQEQIRKAAQNETTRLIQQYSTTAAPDLIFTYHVYHKAPDWIGVAIAQSLGVPYVLAEASFAPKQLYGPWHQGHKQSQYCIQQAERIIAINRTDVECLKPLVKHDRVIEFLKPFLDDVDTDVAADFSQVSANTINQHDENTVNLITVAMMRHGDKKASYKQLADALRKIEKNNWRLTVIGDGNAATEVKQYFETLSSPCLFTGTLSRHSIFRHLLNSDIFVWPAINEALGLAMLEAQACGLPVITQNYGDVATIVDHQVTGFVTQPGNFDTFLSALELLIEDKHKRQLMSDAARQKFNSEHSLKAALSQLKIIFKALEHH